MPYATATHTHKSGNCVCVFVQNIFEKYIQKKKKKKIFYVVSDETLFLKTVLCRFNSLYSFTLGPNVSVRELFN